MHMFLSSASSSRIRYFLGSALVCSMFGLSPAFSETRVETVLGTVTKVDALTSTYTVKTPKDERICEVRDVPIYSEGQQSDELGSMIIGGLLGSAVGNKLSDNNGAGAAGAVAGALLGRSQANKAAKSGEIVGYRQQESCETKRVILEEVRSKITGYRVQVEADGRILNLETSQPLGLNDRVELRKQVSYSLR
jgi:uncharacterized protein YcfJ